jgi:hypothetical protein
MVNYNRFFIIKAMKDDYSFFISNTDPVIWTTDITNSKCYTTFDQASNDILRDYENYHAIKKLLDVSQLDSLFVIEIENNVIEVGRTQIL